MSCAMKAVCGTRVAAQRTTSRPAKVVVQASLRQEVAKVAKAAGVTAASLILAFGANAATVKMGADNGALVFDPANITVAKGEEITWVNNAGFPHNLVFDEDEVPAGVSADAISHDDYFNALGDSYKLKLDTAGTYSYYCEPHQGAGMVGKITVQ